MFKTAYALDPDAALAATSWGAPQILGSNAQAAGYRTAADMVGEMADRSAAHLQAFAAFVKTEGLASSLRAHDWRGFAARYNGTGKAEEYGRKIEAAYQRIGGKASAVVLRIGSEGDGVHELQRALGIGVDGGFGPATERAVKAFQANHGLTADGIVGDKTWDAIRRTQPKVQPPAQKTDADIAARVIQVSGAVTAGSGAVAAIGDALRETPQGMVIVNSRAHALELFQAARAAGLDGLVHLSTRQYPVHRRKILDDIRARLKSPAPCRLIATSLIEAGVDLSFPRGWPAEAGLDSCVQAAGRVNRNDEWPVEDSTLTIFSAPDRPMPAEIRSLAQDMSRVAGQHADLLAPAAIRDWFEHVYWKAGPARLGQHLVDQMVCGASGTDFPFRSMADTFRMIDTAMVPVIIPGDAAAHAHLDRLGIEAVPSGKLARVLQVYTVQVPATARALLIKAGHASFHYPELRGDQFCVLDNMALYHADSGLWWEHAEYLGAEQSIL